MHKDGNAIAGMLMEIFEVEMTTERRTCQSCGQANEIGAHLLYAGAGYVLRCPICGDMAAAIATVPDAPRITMFGSWSVEPPAR